MINPLGITLSCAGEEETILLAECNLQTLTQIRKEMPVFSDRRPELYKK